MIKPSDNAGHLTLPIVVEKSLSKCLQNFDMQFHPDRTTHTPIPLPQRRTGPSHQIVQGTPQL